jgi:3',5'-cyclic AMP phosphodiesterase CpdA
MFKLAHLTDPHLAPLPPPSLSDLIGKRAFGFLDWKRKRSAVHRTNVLDALVRDLKKQPYDHLAVTGDLINLGLTAEYTAARAWLDALGAPDNVTLVPGNHDVYVRQTAALAEHYWSAHMRGDELESFVFVRRRGNVALIGLSSAVPTPPIIAIGHVGKEQLAQLGSLLKTIGQEGLFRVVMIHHPPTSRLKRYHKRLTDGPALRAVLRERGAELLVHGHDHVRRVTWLEGPNGGIPAIGAPSASATPHGRNEPAAYHLYEIDGKAGAWRSMLVVRGYTHGSNDIGEIGRIALAG